MGPLLVRCPKTQHPISTGIETDVASLAKAWSSTVRIPCPHCGETHEFKVRDAYTGASISDDTLGRLHDRLE